MSKQGQVAPTPGPERPAAIEIKKGSRIISIQWADNHYAPSEISFQAARRYCACSRCRASGQVGRLEVDADIDIVATQMMGSSGLNLSFSDGHERGVFPWPYLHAISEGRALDYLEERYAKGHPDRERT